MAYPPSSGAFGRGLMAGMPAALSRSMALLLPLLLAAASAAAPSASGSLDSLLQEAWSKSPKVATAAADVAAAEGALNTNRVWLPNPELEASARSDVVFQNQGELGLDVALVQELAWPGARWARVDAGEQSVRAARLRLALARLEVAADVENALAAVNATAAALHVREDVAKSARALAEAAKRRVEAGDAGQLEATLAAAEDGVADAALRSARADLASSRGVLCVAIGRDECKERAAAASEETMWPALSPLPASSPSTLDARADVRAATADVAAATHAVSAAEATRIPSVRLGVGYGFDRSVVDSSALTDDVVDPDHLLGVTVAVTLPVWDWKSGEIEQARAAAARAEAQRRAVELRARSLVDGALARFQAASDAEQRLVALDDDVGRALADVENAYVAGGLSLDQALTTRDRLMRARLALIDARRAKVNAHADALAVLADPALVGIEVSE